MFPVIDVIPPRRMPVVSIALIAVNTMIFVAELALGEAGRTALFDAYGSAAATAWWPALITGQFIHGGWLHFLSNMVCLWIFGANVEDRLGHERFVLFYVGCGVVAALAQ
jgi:membrane associated rhomboid family serine protease